MPHRAASLTSAYAANVISTSTDRRRKNSLFAGSGWATIATLLQTAKMNDIDPLAWLSQTLERIANGWPNSEIDALLPWNYAR